METQALVFAVGIPLVAVALLMFAGQRGVSTDRNWGAGFGFVAAYLSVHLGTHGLPAGETIESWEWLLVLMPTAAVIGTVITLVRIPISIQLGVIACFSGIAAWLLVPSFQTQPWLWRSVIASLVFVGWSCGLAARDASFRWLLPLVWILVGAASLPVLIASANARFGLMCTSLAAGSGSALLFGLWRRDGNPLQTAVGVLNAAFPAILLNGYFNDYGGVPCATFLLLASAPCLVGWFVIPRPWLPLAIVAVVIVVATVAVWSVWPILTAEPAY